MKDNIDKSHAEGIASGEAKPQKTEFQLWARIETLGAYMYGMRSCQDNRPLSRFERRDLQEMRSEQNQAVNEACQRFNLTHPDDMRPEQFGDNPKPPKPGTKSYWNWYEEQKTLWLEEEYGKIICSACPMSEGFDKFKSLGGTIPCEVWPGALYKLESPERCALLPRGRSNKGMWTRDKLEQEIVERGGKGALDIFVAKETSLGQSLNSEQPVS